MSTNTNQFLVSVADVIIRDTMADQIVAKGKTLINSSIKQAVSNKEIRGGFGNALLYDYSYGKMLDITIEDAKMDEAYIAMNNGTTIVTEARKHYILDEVVTLTGGQGVLAQTPVGTIYVQKPDNTIVTVTPTGKNFDMTGFGLTGTEQVKVTYRENAIVDSITIDATRYPKTYELTMIAKMFTKDGQNAEVQIIIPRFKPSGNFELSFTAEGVSTSKLEGKALADENSEYATYNVKYLLGNASQMTALAAVPGEVNLTTGQTAQLTVYGIQGGAKANIVNPDGTTYATSDAAVVTVNATGLITYVGAGNAVVTVTNGSLKDYVVVDCV